MFPPPRSFPCPSKRKLKVAYAWIRRPWLCAPIICSRREPATGSSRTLRRRTWPTSPSPAPPSPQPRATACPPQKRPPPRRRRRPRGARTSPPPAPRTPSGGALRRPSARGRPCGTAPRARAPWRARRPPPSRRGGSSTRRRTRPPSRRPPRRSPGAGAGGSARCRTAGAGGPAGAAGTPPTAAAAGAAASQAPECGLAGRRWLARLPRPPRLPESMPRRGVDEVPWRTGRPWRGVAGNERRRGALTDRPPRMDKKGVGGGEGNASNWRSARRRNRQAAAHFLYYEPKQGDSAWACLAAKRCIFATQLCCASRLLMAAKRNAYRALSKFRHIKIQELSS
jgi:hypothetical protein